MNSEEFKNTDDNDTAMLRSCFDSLTSKEKLREELDKEQHSLCVYCMKRIESSNQLKVKIEHYIPLSEDKEKIFDYNNLFLACIHKRTLSRGTFELLQQSTGYGSSAFER